MIRPRTNRVLIAPWLLRRGRLAACLAAFAVAAARAQSSPPAPVVLDRIVAVVNDQAILASDLDNEIRLSILEPRTSTRTVETPGQALQRLISRTLIQQQIREEDSQAAQPSAQDVAARLAILRKELPACVHQSCTSDAGWKQFLSSHGLTQQEVETYLKNRLAILHFIELRFRQGIRISHEEIETYYHDMLLPQYTAGETAPPLDQVAPRIQEILLQQQVNALFSVWLDNLRKQGRVEVLDPNLEAAVAASRQGAGTQ